VTARRTCRICGVEKPLTAQYFQKRTDGGWRWECKEDRATAKRVNRRAGVDAKAGDLAKPPVRFEDLPEWAQAMCCQPYGTLPLNSDSFALFFERFAKLPLPEHARVWVDAVLSNSETVVSVFPGSAKTTILSQWLTMWLFACVDRSTELIVVSKTATVGKKVSLKVAHELEYNRDLIGTFGRFRDTEVDRPWRITAGELEIDGHDRDKGAGDLSLQIRGSGMQIFGMRANWVIADDPTDASVATSETERLREQDWFHSEVLTRLRPEGHVIVIGQRVHMLDLYGYLAEVTDDMTGEHVWHVINQSAVTDWDMKAVLWPEVWSWQRLMRVRRRIGGVRFDCEYMQKPSPADNVAVAQLAWILGEGGSPGCLDRERRVGQPPAINVFVPHVRVISVDPSGGRYFAGVVVADVSWDMNTGEATYHVVDIFREKVSYNELLGLLKDACGMYQPEWLIFEENALRAFGKDNAIADLKLLVPGGVIAHSTTSTSKQDRNYGLMAMSRIFELGLLRLPYADSVAQDTSKVLIDEALGLAVTTDVLMALWFIFNNSRRLKALVPGMLPTRFKRGPLAMPGTSPWGEAKSWSVRT
jgi:hypothetical protein